MSNRRRFLQTTAYAVALQSRSAAQSAEQLQKSTSGENRIHETFIRQAIEIAASARKKGNHPFGALLADDRGRLMITAENTVMTRHDPTRHAELNLVQLACESFPPEALSKATLYTSTEPCVMCCGAIHWAGILFYRRVVMTYTPENGCDTVAGGGVVMITWMVHFWRRIEILLHRVAGCRPRSIVRICTGAVANEIAHHTKRPRRYS